MNKPELSKAVNKRKSQSSTVAKRSAKKRTAKKKVKSSKFKKLLWATVVVLSTGLGIWFGLQFSDGLKYFFGDKSIGRDAKSIFDVRTIEVIERHKGMTFGFDVSQYQGVIAWEEVDSIGQRVPLDFVFIRSTMGKDGVDKAFDLNWKGAKSNHFVRGAYHYYRPNENSLEQAKNFIKKVTLSSGDLPPVLDIEELPKQQSMDSLRSGLKRWISAVETHYKVKPILYTGEHYYKTHLKQWFPDHVLWIANYNFFVEEIKPDWTFWQFTEKGMVKGIDGKVDLNVYQGTKIDLRKLVIR